MKHNLITKIALGVAIAALAFSIVTLIRALILNNGVFLAVIIVIGTAIVTAICAIMLYVLSTYEPVGDEETAEASDEDDAEAADAADEPDSDTAEEQPEDTAAGDPIEEEVDELLEKLESEGGYHLDNFE